MSSTNIALKTAFILFLAFWPVLSLFSFSRSCSF